MSEERIARWALVEFGGKIKLTSDGIPYVCCSLCGGSEHAAYFEEKGKRKFCYECGAKMDTSDTKPGEYNN